MAVFEPVTICPERALSVSEHCVNGIRSPRTAGDFSMNNDAAHSHPVPVVACMTCGQYMPISQALGKSTTGSSVIYYLECSRCGQQFKSSSEDVLLDLGPTSHIEDASE